MARPREFDSDAAVEFVMHEIWQDGFQAASVKSLSEKLSITRSSFYNAFGSREDLFRHAFQKYMDESPGQILMGMTPKTPFKPVITHLFREICRQRGADETPRGCMAVNCVAEMLPDNSGLGAFITETVLSNLERIEELIGWAVERGELGSKVDPHATALAVQNLMMGINLLCKIVPDEQELWMTASTTLKGLGLYQEFGAGENATP